MWYVPITTGNPLVTSRTLEELKQEIERRVRHGLPPLAGISIEDARAALDSISSLERDAWAQAWSARGDTRLERAVGLEARDPQQARHQYWCAWRLLNFARWPVENTPFKKYTYPRALAAFRNYGRLLDPPVEMVRIPFENEVIVGYLRAPRARTPAPLVIGVSGLDSRKEDVAGHGDAYLARGLALLALDMPGTGEAPAPLGPKADRMFSCVLDYISARSDLDAARVVVQGRSWSGYWAAKLAYTEHARLSGAVMHGGPIHHYFQPGWLGPSLESHEYLYDYLPATARLFGAENLQQLLAAAPAYSLLDAGVLEGARAPMLLVNGARDSQVPIADLELLRERGAAAEAWVNPDGGHMGRSADWPPKRIFDEVLLPWMLARVNGTR
ncbi:MAG: alpha/beta hydrolase [Betaproteobacteria bacterium]|nr:alpha/beta hydrolase [Betaproteobacteria bacterium]